MSFAVMKFAIAWSYAASEMSMDPVITRDADGEGVDGGIGVVDGSGRAAAAEGSEEAAGA